MQNAQLTGRLPVIIPAVLLLAAVFGHWHYGFYTLLRFVVCGCAIYLAVKAGSTGSAAWTWIFGAMAVMFNPLLPIHLHRGMWRLFDLAAALALLLFACLTKRTARQTG